MLLRSLLGDPAKLRIALLLVGIAILALVFLYFDRKRRIQQWMAEQARQAGVSAHDDERAAEPDSPDFPSAADTGPVFRTLQPGSSVATDVLRGLLIVLACLVGAGLLLVALPQGGFDRIAEGVRFRKAAAPPQEKLAFLYLGDEAKGNEFHIRGVVRNISTLPITQVDATIRLYAPDRTLLETAVVRMDSELIPPDAIATFHLTYPEYHGQFGSYSIDFKLRQGELVPYKDMRALRARD